MAGRLTADNLLDLWRKILDKGYTDPMEQAGPGYGIEVYEAHAAIIARVAEAIDVTTQATFILPSSAQTNPPASGPQKATATLTLARTKYLQIAVQINAGEIQFQDEVGRRFVVTAGDLLSVGEGSGSVEVEAVLPGYGFNVPEGEIDEFVQNGSGFSNSGASVEIIGTDYYLVGTESPDTLIADHVGQYVLFTSGSNAGEIRRISAWQVEPGGGNRVTLVDDSGAATALVAESGTAGWRILDWADDFGFTVTNEEAASGGKSGMLDTLGHERRIYRGTAGESDDVYRERIATLPDVVSPNAIRRAANRVLSEYGETAVLREVGTPCLPGFYWDKDPYDIDVDLQPLDRFIFWLDLLEFRGFFLLGFPVRSDGEFGLFYDDAGPLDANGAYDVPEEIAGFFDGYPALWWGSIAGVWNQVNAVKAAGVGFDFYLIGDGDPPCI